MVELEFKVLVLSNKQLLLISIEVNSFFFFYDIKKFYLYYSIDISVVDAVAGCSIG